MVIDDALHRLFLERRAVCRLAKRAIVAEPARTPRNLRQLVRPQIAPLPPVELPPRGKRDVPHIKVQPHADGVRRDDVVDLA